MYVTELGDEGFYTVTKSLFIGSDTPSAVTELDLTTSQYKHKGVLLTFIDNSNGNGIEIKFYDQSTADGLSSEYVKVSVLATAAVQPFVLPCRVAKIRVINGPDAVPMNKQKVQVGLLN